MAKRKKRTKFKEIEYEVSSGNVYADFGYSNPEEADAKADLAMLISSIIKQRKMTQKEAARLIGVDQPKISKIMRGLLSEFTIERLINYLLSLGFDIEIKPIPHKVKTSAPAIHIIKSNNRRSLNI